MCAYLPIHLPLLTLTQQSIIRHFKQRWWCVSRVHMAPSKGTKICNWPRKTVFVSITAASPPAVDFYDPVTLGLYVLPREMGSHRWKLTGMQLNHSKLTNKLILGQNGEVNISSSHWEWLGDPHLQMMAKRLLKMFMLGSSCWEQQFPTEDSSSGTVIVGWDSGGMPECFLHVLWLRPYPASFLIHRGPSFHFLPCWIGFVTINPTVRLLEGRSNYTKGL